MYRKQPFMSVPTYSNQPMSSVQGNPHSTYSSCPPNSSPYCQGSFQSSQPGWEIQDMYGNQPFMPTPTYPYQPLPYVQDNPYSIHPSCPPNNPSYYQGSSYEPQSGWGTPNICENQPFMPVPTYPNYAEPTSLWQPPTQTPYPPDMSYGTFSGNGYASQYQLDSPPQSMPSFMSQNPYPTIGVSIGNVYQINATPSTDPRYLAQFAQELLRYESEQQPILGANIGWAMGKEAFQQDIPANCYVDASPRIVINLAEQPNQNEDENTTSNMIDTTLTDTE